MRMSIVGAGYVGLVTGACLAETGHEVVLADLDRSKVEAINSGRSPIYEPGLDELVARHAGKGLRATTDVADAVLSTDVTFIAVGTPIGADGIDLSAVVGASRTVGEALGDKGSYHTVVVKSTVVPGTTADVVGPTIESTSSLRLAEDVGVGVNPEFLTEGRAVADFMEPDRLVLGAEDERTHDVLREIYASVDERVPRMLTNTRTAEMIKYASNALLATMISFANEIANLCQGVGGVDVVDVMRGVHASDYLSPVGPGGERVVAPITSFLEAGCGFGGSCLPKDLRALLAEGERRGVAMPILRAVLETNDARAAEVVDLLEASLGDLAGRRLTVLGIAFKPDTDDVRESPAVPIVRRLLDRSASVTLHDPIVRELPAALVGTLASVEPNLARALDGADAVVLVTRWEEYRDLPRMLEEASLQPLVVDGRRLLDPRDVERYVGIGQG